MMVIHILLLFLNLLYVDGFNIVISTPVKIIDCRAERDEGFITVKTTTHTQSYEVPVDPKEFYEAAVTGDIGYITAELARGDSSSRLSRMLTWRNEDDSNRTALHVAAAEGHDQVVLALLEAGASPNAKEDLDSWTPVHEAAFEGHKAALKSLLQPKYKAHINLQDETDRTPVFLAAGNGRTGVLKVLIAHGGDVNTMGGREYGGSPLMGASGLGKLSAVQALLNAGARVGDVDDEGSTALHRAARNNHTDVARLLLQSGADKRKKNNSGRIPADEARYYNHNEIAEFIRIY